MSALVTTEIVIGAALLAIIASAVFLWFRRRYIAGGLPLMLCALRTEASPRWRLGLVRLAGDGFEYFSVVGPSLRPVHRWVRHQLELSAPEPLAESVPGLPADAVQVSGTCGPTPCGLAFSPAVSTAVRAWMESSPPGFNVNVA